MKTKKTREHIAWDIFKKRMDYLNSFPGNRNMMEEFTKIFNKAWAESEEVFNEEVKES